MVYLFGIWFFYCRFGACNVGNVLWKIDTGYDCVTDSLHDLWVSTWRCIEGFGVGKLCASLLLSGFAGSVSCCPLSELSGRNPDVYIMFGGARRLELRQNKNYGDDPEYQQYVKTTTILLPFIPLYSVAKYKWLVG